MEEDLEELRQRGVQIVEILSEYATEVVGVAVRIRCGACFPQVDFETSEAVDVIDAFEVFWHDVCTLPFLEKSAARGKTKYISMA